MVRGRQLQLRELHAWFGLRDSARARQRLLALGAALALHLIGVLGFLMVQPILPSESQNRIIDVAFFIPQTVPPEPEPDPEISPVEPELIELEPTDPSPETEAVIETAAISDVSPETAVSAPSALPDMEFSDAASREAYRLSPGTRSVLSGIQCPGNVEAFQRTGVCPQSARRSAMVTASGETALDHFAIDVDAIRALFGVAPHHLSGQATLANSSGAGTLSSADSMRDRLPASQPDPAFGD